MPGEQGTVHGGTADRGAAQAEARGLALILPRARGLRLLLRDAAQLP